MRSPDLIWRITSYTNGGRSDVQAERNGTAYAIVCCLYHRRCPRTRNNTV